VNATLNHEIDVIDLGRVEYQTALEFQTMLFDEILAVKKANRDRPAEDQLSTKNYLIFCEHPHVFTLGKSGEEKNLLLEKDDLKQIGATYFHINRGGDITYHGAGQIVVYPILDLENFFTDIHKYMRLLEESVILTLKDYSIESGRIPGLTGVWLGANAGARKICALGVKTSRWVTLHGLAFNVNTDLHYFDYIVPCGISDKAVTSMEKELGGKQDIDEVKNVLRKHLLALLNESVSHSRA
jgi:lipoyl(octanoyl) transferase